jgi:hypothetical protein
MLTERLKTDWEVFEGTRTSSPAPQGGSIGRRFESAESFIL